MKSKYTVTLSSIDIFQTIDALSSRAESYEQTACYLKGNYDVNADIVIEECSDPFEAREIAKHYRDIATSIENQF